MKNSKDLKIMLLVFLILLSIYLIIKFSLLFVIIGLILIVNSMYIHRHDLEELEEKIINLFKSDYYEEN